MQRRSKRLSVPVLLVVMVFGAHAAPVTEQRGAVLILPTPKEITVGTNRVSLPRAVAIHIAAEDSPVVRYAAAGLAKELEDRFSRNVMTEYGSNRNTAPPGKTVISLSVDPALPVPPEGYVLTVTRTGDVPEVQIAGTDPGGLLYGTFTLRTLLEQTDGGPIPCPLTIRDWPTMSVRATTGLVRNISEASLKTLDWWARWRINAGYYEIYGDRGQDSVPPEIKKVIREAARRGITVYGCVSNWRTNRYLKRPLCPSNPEDAALVERLFDELAAAGCTALVFLFDDIPQAAITHPLTCPDCRKRFGDLAGSQAFWVKRMAAVAERRGIHRLLMCPTPYYRGWRKTAGGKLDGVAYFARLGPVCERLGVEMYFCPYRAAAVAEAVAAGLRNFTWWYNGVYPIERTANRGQFDSRLWGGLQELEFGWYNTEWDPTRGLVVKPDVADALKSLPARTRSAWLCAGGQVPWVLWGIYTWGPEKYDAESARRAAVASVLGDWKGYEAWKKVIRKWMMTLAGADKSRLDPAARDALLDALERDAAAAERAIGSAARPAHALADEKTIQGILGQMRRSVHGLRTILEQGRSGRVEVALSAVKQRSTGAGKRFDQTMTLGSFDVRYQLRYAIEKKDGSWHRCRWHFGSGLGMPAPSNRNWYDAGFIDVLVDGHSLDETRATFEQVGNRVRGTWKTTGATVILTLQLRPDAGLAIHGRVLPGTASKPPSIVVKLWCIPSAGSWNDMDKWIATATRTVQHTRSVRLDPVREPWIIFYDKTYDIPHLHAEGPAGLLLDPDAVEHAAINLASYVVETAIHLKPGARTFRLAVWDFHGSRNADILAAWRAHPPTWETRPSRPPKHQP